MTQIAQWDLPQDPEQVAKVREMVREILIAWSLPRLVDDAQIIVSELYTNAVLYGREPITLTLRFTGGHLRGAITDRAPVFVPQQRRAEPDEDHGRGLEIVGAYANGWGITPVIDGAGKEVWFDLAEQ